MNSNLPAALITGASCGIGRSIAGLLAEHGHALILTARREQLLETTAAELQATHHVPVQVVPHDLSKPGSAAELYDRVAELGRPVEVLVNNAGFGLQGQFAETELSAQLQLLQVNIMALTELTHLFLQPMLERRSGRILNVSSIAAFVPGPLMATYHASKAYVLSFSEALANEVKGTGVSVTCLCPGPTRTEFDRRAGLTGSKSFSGKLMSADAVAQVGYDAMMRGKSCAVAGLKNKAQLWPTPLMPRSVLASFARKFNEVGPDRAHSTGRDTGRLATRLAAVRPRNP